MDPISLRYLIDEALPCTPIWNPKHRCRQIYNSYKLGNTERGIRGPIIVLLLDMAVVLLGDPVVDLLVSVDDSTLSDLDITPGGCLPIERADLDCLLESIKPSEPCKKVHGGSAANVANGLANLTGRKVSFAGMVGADEAGREYERHLRAQSVDAILCQSNTGASTATCLCLVTPDGQRTMRTCLAAASELQSADQLCPGWVDGCALLHLEGYCMYRPQLARGAMQAARKAGALVSIDLASFELVRNCSKTLLGLLEEGCIDIVFCNEEEAQALAVQVQGRQSSVAAGDQTQRAQQFLLQHCQVSIISLGANGCMACNRAGEKGNASAPAATVVDTVGAGDLFTSGFLHAFLGGANLQACAECGCEVGSASVQSPGAELSGTAWERLRKKVQGILARHK